MSNPNIVQAELFISGGKTVVRFFDHTGEFTQYVSAYMSHKVRMHTLLPLLVETRGVVYWWYALQYRRLSRKQRNAKQKAEELLGDRLETVAEQNDSIAMECIDRSFRPAHQSELYDVQRAAWTFYEFWLFVFKPNDLCADKNVAVASLM